MCHTHIMLFTQVQLYLYTLRPVSQEMDANLHVTPVSGAGVNISCLCVKDETQIQYQASPFSQASCSRPIVELLLQMLITILPPSFFRIQSRNCDGTRALILFSWMCGRDWCPFYPCEAILCSSWSSCSTSADGPWLARLLLRVLQDHPSAHRASQAWPEWGWCGVWGHLPLHPRLWLLRGPSPER